MANKTLHRISARTVDEVGAPEIVNEKTVDGWVGKTRWTQQVFVDEPVSQHRTWRTGMRWRKTKRKRDQKKSEKGECKKEKEEEPYHSYDQKDIRLCDQRKTCQKISALSWAKANHKELTRSHSHLQGGGGEEEEEEEKEEKEMA